MGGSIAIKWATFVGEAFIKKHKVFVPIQIVGQPLMSRSSVIVHKMCLEVISISKKSLKN